MPNADVLTSLSEQLVWDFAQREQYRSVPLNLSSAVPLGLVAAQKQST